MVYKYWGEYDSSIIFCEDKYVKSKYVAEYFNTISGLVYIVSGLRFINTKIKIYGFVLFLMGLGTIFLHGTLRWYGQWMDELAMLSLLFYYIKGVYFDLSHGWLGIIIGLYVVFNENHNIFMCMFLFLVTYQYKTVLLIVKEPINKYYINIYTSCMILGSFFWLLDRICFTKTINFHVFWHLLSAAASYYGTFIYLNHIDLLDNSALKILNWYRIMKRNKHRIMERNKKKYD